MKKLIKICSFLIVLTLLLSSIHCLALVEESDIVIALDNVYGSPEGTVNVDVTIENNPGILGATLCFTYDNDLLTLTNAVAGDAFSALIMSKPGKLTSPCRFSWDGESLKPEDIKDGIVLTLTFQISENAIPGTDLDIEISYSGGDIVDSDLNPVNPQAISGTIQVIDYTPGDVDGDKVINAKDLILIRRYINGGYDVTINEYAADVNDDGKINTTDIILIRRYIAGGYGVKLKPSHGLHEHIMEAFAYKAPTCEKEGNEAYWYCTFCNNYYADEKGTVNIALKDTILKKTDEHTIVIDEGVAPTTSSKGLTEGSHCSVCDTVFVAQKELPPLEAHEYSITYYIANKNDMYLSSIEIENPNPNVYVSEEGLELEDITVEGYKFKGWYTSQTGGVRVTEISVGSVGNRKLYAQWDDPIEYTITFDSPFITVEPIKDHKVNSATSLPGEDKMKLYGYRWLGWSDEEGNLYSTYPVGKAGNVTLYANWQSDRNKAVPVEKLSDPEILIDEDSKTYFFTFELGTIENVPLQVINDFGKMVPGQPTVKKEVTNKIALTDNKATEIASTIAKATTQTTTWTLANEWNNISSVSQSHCSELGIDFEKIDYDFSSKSTQLNLSSDAGGSTNETVNWGVNAKIYGKNTTEVGAEAKFPVKIVNVGVSAKNTTEIGGELSGHYDKTTVNDSYWNTKGSYNECNDTVKSTTTRNSLSQHVRDSYGYSTTQSQGGSNSTSEGYSIGNSETNEYSTLIAYTTEEIEETSYITEYTTEIEGWWRQLIVGNIHVIGVVAYDMETSTYSVFTYNVLDEKTSQYMDFSRTSGNYNDFETGVIPFEVPYSVNEYISYALGYSEGLEIDKATGIITKYSGNEEHVHIPDYYTVSNGDGTYSAIKVTGLADGVFANKTSVKTVRLGKYITKIPNNAFNGCTALESVEYENITFIGEYSFANCTSLKKFNIDKTVTSLGLNAFKNVSEVVVYAADSNIVKTATVCGAKTISIYLNGLSDTLSDSILAIPATTEKYTLYGRDDQKNIQSFSNLRIDSNAKNTVINGINFVDNSDVVLKINSEEVTLAEVTIEQTPNFAIVLTADSTKLYLMDKITVSSESANTILAHALELFKAPGTATATSLTITNGKLFYCTDFTDEGGLFAGEKVQVGENSYNQLLTDSLPWILASEVPEGAEVVNTKWTYDLTTRTTSNSSTAPSGYTSYKDPTWVWGEYGAWSSWSKTAVSSSDSRKIETKTVTDKEAYKLYHYYYYYNSNPPSGYFSWTYSDWGGNKGYKKYTTQATYQFTYCSTYVYGGKEYKSYLDPNSKTEKWFLESIENVPAKTHTEYRYADRSKVYTYYYQKVEAKESTTEVSTSDTISNVQKWVQYIVK